MGKNKGKKQHQLSDNNDDNDIVDATTSSSTAAFHWKESTSTSLSPDVASALALFTARVHAHIDSAYHAVLGEQLRYICQQASTLDSSQPAALLAYLSAHACALDMKETWDKVVSNVVAVGFKIGLRKGRRAPDDKLYLQNPDLQENLPRGIIFTRDLKSQRVDLVLFSNRKFYGRAHGDDDDTDICSHALRDGRFKHFIVSDKANGESAQIALLRDGITFVIGSKNRKIAVQRRADVDKYKDQCYSFAVEMAECFFEDYYDRLPDAAKAELRQFLTVTRLTLNFEFESQLHQHLVPLFKRRLVLIGLTGVHLVGGRSAHPCLGAAVARWFGFPSVILETTLFAKDQLNTVCDRIAHQWELEGSVLVLLDDAMQVVDLVKVKTWWYIILRAVREKLRQLRGKSSLARQCRLIRSRLDTLQRAMHIDARVIARFQDLACAFAVWMIADQPQRETDKDFVKRARTADRTDTSKKRTRLELFHQDQYPLLWRQFLADSQLPHTDALLAGDVSGSLPSVQIDEVQLPLLVVMQGVPGLGKSVLAVETTKLLAAAGISASQAAQDDFVHLGQKKSGPACLEHITDLLEDGRTRVVMLARNNANKLQYHQYQQLNLDGICRMAFFAPEELQGLGAIDSAAAIPDAVYKLMYMCVASVLHRKAVATSATEHPTNEMAPGKLVGLPFAFLKMYEPHPAAITVPFLASTAPMPPAPFCARVRAVLGFGAPGEADDFADDNAGGNNNDDNNDDDDDDNDDDDKGRNKNNRKKKQQQQQQKKQQQQQQQKKPSSAASDDALLQSWGLGTREQVGAVVAQSHRPLPELAAAAQAAIASRVSDDELPAVGSYIAAKLSMEASTEVASVLGPFAPSWNVLCDHVTLVHSNNYGLHKEKWNELLTLTGVDVRIKPVSLLRSEQPPLVVLGVSVMVGDRVIDSLVASGEPHITIATGPGVKAYQAGPALTEARQRGVLQPAGESVGAFLEASLELVLPE